MRNWLYRMIGRETPVVAAQRRIVRSWPVTVENTRADIDTDGLFTRIDRVLGLVEHHVPDRYDRLRTDVSGFQVIRFPCRGAFQPASHECVVELTFLADSGRADEEIAATVVHEGEHARHRAMTAPGVSPAEEERACREAELEFGLRARHDKVIERARASLDLADHEVAPDVDWPVAVERMRAVDQAARDGGRRPQ